MDPNVTLAELLVALGEYNTGASIGHEPDMAAAAETVVERFGDLNDWLSRGGFLPKEWSK